MEVGGGEVEALRVAGAGREWGVMTHEARGWEGVGRRASQFSPSASREALKGFMPGVVGRAGPHVCLEGLLCFEESGLGRSGSQVGRQVMRPQVLSSR